VALHHREWPRLWGDSTPQLFAVLIELHLVGRPATREEMNDFIIKDLAVLSSDVVDIFMIPSA
jgi:hypothetical protein